MALPSSMACKLLRMVRPVANYYAFPWSATMFNEAVSHADYEGQMTKSQMVVRATAAAMLTLVVVTTAKAQSVADFYRGKTITYNLAVPDGASWGLYARTFIEHLRKHVPGNPTIILQVMPGGGGQPHLQRRGERRHRHRHAAVDRDGVRRHRSRPGAVRPAQIQLDRIDGGGAGRHHRLAHGAGQDPRRGKAHRADHGRDRQGLELISGRRARQQPARHQVQGGARLQGWR